MTPKNFEAQAREYAKEQGADCVHIPGGVGECIYIHSGCDLEKAFLAGARAGVLAAASVAEEYWKSGKNQYARHSGRAVESRIKALIEEKK